MKLVSILTIFISLVFTQMTFAAVKAPCDIVKTIATRTNPESRIYGNAIAVDNNHIIANDHSFYRETQQTIMIVMRDGKMMPATIVNRDFHLNLAVLSVGKGGGGPLTGCDLNNPIPKDISEVTVYNFNAGIQLEEQKAKILTMKSSALLVPGIATAIEINMKFQDTMSGGAALIGDQIVGMLSQPTGKNTSLLIPAEILLTHFRSALFGAGERRYKFLPKDKKFEFKGFDLPFGGPHLKIAPHEGRQLPTFKMTPPHEGKQGGGGVHEGMNTNPSASEIFKIAISTQSIVKQSSREPVVIDITDVHEMYQRQPKLTELLVASQSERIAVLSIDGIAIENNLDFIRVMEICTVCTIDRFLILGSNREQLADNLLQLALKINNMGAEIYGNAKPAELDSLRYIFSSLVGSLTNMAEMRTRGRIDPRLARFFIYQWAKLGDLLATTIITDEISNLIYEIELMIAQARLKIESIKSRGIL